jgi:predicted phosphodiesterase
MTTAFISDIHGNMAALEAVLGDIDRQGITRIVYAGDVAGYYTEINACCDALRSREIPTVMGNHDWYLGGDGHCLRSRSVNDCLAYQRSVVTPDNKAWLANLPLQVLADGVRVVHGGWADPLDEYLKPTAEYFAALDGQFFLSGHSHLPCIERFDRQVYCNPGSVGQPRDGDPRAAYALFDGQTFELRRVAYDVRSVFERMAAAGFNDYYYGSLATGARRLRRLADPQEISA